GLELVGVLLTLCVIGSVLVGRFGNDEGVSGGVNYSRLVACSEARGIRLRCFLGHAGHQRRENAGGKNQHDTASRKRLAERLTARSFCLLQFLHNTLSYVRVVACPNSSSRMRDR